MLINLFKGTLRLKYKEKCHKVHLRRVLLLRVKKVVRHLMRILYLDYWHQKVVMINNYKILVMIYTGLILVQFIFISLRYKKESNFQDNKDQKIKTIKVNNKMKMMNKMWNQLKKLKEVPLLKNHNVKINEIVIKKWNEVIFMYLIVNYINKNK